MSEIYVRLGASDVIIKKEDYNKTRDDQPEDASFYFIGYELEDGTECEEDGTPLTK